MKRLLLSIALLMSLPSCTETMSQIGTNTLSSAFNNHSYSLAREIVPGNDYRTTYPLRSGLRSVAREGFKSTIGNSASSHNTRGRVIRPIGDYTEKLRTCTPYYHWMPMGASFDIKGMSNDGRCIVIKTLSSTWRLDCAHSAEYRRLQAIDTANVQDLEQKECVVYQDGRRLN